MSDPSGAPEEVEGIGAVERIGAAGAGLDLGIPPVPPGRFGRGLLEVAGALDPLLRARRWILSAVLIGVLPLLIAWPLGLPFHQALSGVLVSAFVWSLVLQGRFGAALAGLGLAFLSHSLLAIALSANAPEQAAPLFPDGAAYWAKQEAWIRSGHDPEYELAAWLPLHVELLVAALILAPLTLGLAIFARGFYEVDLMNFYVGNMLRTGGLDPGVLAFGWHPWSICRGLCYLFLTTELVAWTCERLTRRSPPAARARAAPWRSGSSSQTA